MEKLDLVLIVDNNSLRVAEAQKNLRDAKVSENIKVAVNGEHALVCLEHLNMFNNLKGKKVLVLLNMDTPMMSGAELLESSRYKNLPGKDAILIVVMKDISSPYSVELAKQKGVSSFVSSPLDVSQLNSLINENFAEKMKARKMANKPMTMN